MNAFEQTAAYPALPGTSVSYYSMDLLVMASATQITAAQFDTENNQLISLFEYSFTGDRNEQQAFLAMEKLLDQEGLFRKPYRKEVFSLNHPFSTLIPADLFEKDNTRQYLALLFDLPDRQVFLHDEVKSCEIINAYSLPETWWQAILSRFPAAAIRHFATPLLAGCHARMRSGSHPDGNATFCHLRQKMLDLVVFRSGKLLYFNSFPFHNREELVYYILFVLEQLAMDAHTTEVVLLGDMEKGAERTAFIKTFLGNVSTGSGPLKEHEVGVSGDPDLARHFNLLSLRLCV